ncbi:MAG TPA: hypothetical protein VM219_03700, partial [Phycisphaerae bacterium]|nr:hypothetical protein [Phycisphaerae bacterium]
MNLLRRAKEWIATWWSLEQPLLRAGDLPEDFLVLLPPGWSIEKIRTPAQAEAARKAQEQLDRVRGKISAFDIRNLRTIAEVRAEHRDELKEIRRMRRARRLPIGPLRALWLRMQCWWRRKNVPERIGHEAFMEQMLNRLISACLLGPKVKSAAFAFREQTAMERWRQMDPRKETGPFRALWGNVRAWARDNPVAASTVASALAVVVLLAVMALLHGCETRAEAKEPEAGRRAWQGRDIPVVELPPDATLAGSMQNASKVSATLAAHLASGLDEMMGGCETVPVTGVKPVGLTGQPPIILQALAPAERTAIETVESGGDPKAWKKDEDARGIIQIRPIYVADANRILGVERFKHDDAFDPVKAWQMFEV